MFRRRLDWMLARQQQIGKNRERILLVRRCSRWRRLARKKRACHRGIVEVGNAGARQVDSKIAFGRAGSSKIQKHDAPVIC